MRLARHLWICAPLGAMLLFGCAAPQGEPRVDSEVPVPSQISDFATLYGQNCAGCHGTEGHKSAAISLADPVYLAIADDMAIRKAIADGVSGTAMPAFAQAAGGMLTDAQINVITNGMRSHWGQPGILGGANPPSYAAKSTGNAERGGAAFKTYCESCHGTGGRGGPKASSVVNDSFLALVSDQGLRTVVIVGRPDLGAPDWRSDAPGKPMSDQEITDIVSWLVSQRSQNPGEPYSISGSVQHQESVDGR